MLIKTEVMSYTMLFIENETKCPACGSEATRRVRRQGLERACLDRVFECGDCQVRVARPKHTIFMPVLSLLVGLKLLK